MSYDWNVILPGVELVQTQPELQTAVHDLGSAHTIFLDTEFESTRDGTTLCLLQLSAGRTIYLIDTLRLTTIDALASILGKPDRAWVLHAGQQDVALLMTRLGLKQRPRVFDTQVAWALLSAEYSVSLSYLQYRLLGIRAGKAHQADDWKRRPLPRSQLAYAASDIEHLPELHRLLGERTAALGRAPLVERASADVVWPEAEPAALLTLESFRNAWQLDPKSQAALKAMIEWYNELGQAARRHAPEPKTLLAIAGRLPETVADLGRIKGVSRGFCQAQGEALVRRLHSLAAELDDFAVIEPPPYATFEEIRLDAWLTVARAEICAKLSVAPELAMPGRVLRPLKAALLATGDVAAAASYFQGWRAELLAGPFTEFARAHPLPAAV